MAWGERVGRSKPECHHHPDQEHAQANLFPAKQL
jgi:hypothetical protein